MWIIYAVCNSIQIDLQDVALSAQEENSIKTRTKLFYVELSLFDAFYEDYF